MGECNMDKENNKNPKQPLMSKGMIIALIVTIVVVAATVTTVLLLFPKNNSDVQTSEPVSYTKPFDYDKQADYDDWCYCCEEEYCDYCDCGDCEECYCDDCECCSYWDCEDDCYDDECTDSDHEHDRKEDYTEEELENVLNSDIFEITSTSELNERGINYSAENLIDNSLEDAWIEGADDVGIGQSVYLRLTKTHIISGIKINPGYQHSREKFNSTSRPRSLLIEFSSGRSIKIELDDDMTTQTYTFDTPVIAKGVKITIDSVYEGKEYSNTAISEISLF